MHYHIILLREIDFLNIWFESTKKGMENGEKSTDQTCLLFSQ